VHKSYQETSNPLEATQLARHAINRGAKVVIAAGGDGTVNEVANGLVNTDAALGVLPLGTINSWALQMGIPALNPMLPDTKLVKLIADLEERIARPLPANYYRMDVCVFKGDGFFTFVHHAMNVLSHRHLQDPKVEYYQCSEIVVESARSLPVHVDGEPFTKTPVAIRTVPSSLKVIVPKIVPGNLFSPLTCSSRL